MVLNFLGSSFGVLLYAANCIGEIQQKTNPSEWFWVQCILNIADWITEGSPLLIWAVKAPDFLCHPENEWPVVSQTSETDFLDRVKTVFVAVVDNAAEQNTGK